MDGPVCACEGGMVRQAAWCVYRAEVPSVLRRLEKERSKGAVPSCAHSLLYHVT